MLFQCASTSAVSVAAVAAAVVVVGGAAATTVATTCHVIFCDIVVVYECLYM